MIAVVDLGFGNLNSVRWALERLGEDVRVTGEGGGLADADGIVLPGVGHFGAAAERLASTGLAREIRTRAEEVPLLGICLGLQLLFDWSEEGGEGLSILQGAVRRLEPGSLPLPHTGWNGVELETGSEFLAGVGPGEAYFTHSYAVEPKDASVVAAWTEYGPRFVSAVRRGPIFGVQFHPERSGAYGRKVLARFLEEVHACSRSSPRSTFPRDASSA